MLTVQPVRHFRKDLFPLVRTFFDREVVRLTRPDRKGWANANRPFHSSKSKISFSANMTRGAWLCWGCDLRGEMVKFVRLHYHFDFIAAAKVPRRVGRRHISRKRRCNRSAAVRGTTQTRRRTGEDSGTPWQAPDSVAMIARPGGPLSQRVSAAFGLAWRAVRRSGNSMGEPRDAHVAIAEADADYCELSGVRRTNNQAFAFQARIPNEEKQT